MGGGTGALTAQVGAQLLADLAQRGDLGGAERVEYQVPDGRHVAGAAATTFSQPGSVRIALVYRPSPGSGSRRTNARCSSRLITFDSRDREPPVGSARRTGQHRPEPPDRQAEAVT